MPPIITKIIIKRILYKTSSLEINIIETNNNYNKLTQEINNNNFLI